jgi:uroporphyrinogen decarboxylase
MQSSDGIHSLLPPEKMTPAARKMRDFYAIKPGAPFYQKEFGYYCLDRWHAEGLPADADLAQFFDYDKGGIFALENLGWCEAAFEPIFEEKVLEDLGNYELVQDFSGRSVLYFKGRRNGFMPEYKDHPVKDLDSWKRNCLWRLDPADTDRLKHIDATLPSAAAAAGRGDVISQHLVGGYMYLRSLIGPERLLYTFYDDPDLIHACMQGWFELADAVIARHQRAVTLDELFIAEDICYNHGPLISPAMIREFHFPYYQQLLANIKARQIDSSRHLYFQVDTDGFCDPVIPLYRELGLDYMSPFEAASGCDVVRTGREYPDLRILGGVDKRELAKGKDAIDRMVDAIYPVMRERGGYIPTCDHGVPEEVSLEDYMHFRKRCLEFAR